ncbi:glycosyltransferase family 2 protein [Bdellovibrionales bacterium]|nr:glycosyltransferase family 2 protein [Bdellovibrionales bacterium]
MIESTEKLLLSVVVPTHDRQDDLFTLLRSIKEQSLPVENFEVLVVSHQVDLPLGKKIRESDEFNYKIRYFEVGKRGINLARNLGLEKSQANIIYFLDDSYFLDSRQTLEKVLELHRTFSSYVGIGGACHTSLSEGLCALAHQWIQDSWLQSGLITPPKTAHLIAGNISYKRDLIGEDLQFDSHIINEDFETELNLRLLQKGHHLCFSKELKLSRSAKTTLHSLLISGYQQGRSFYIRNLRGLETPSPHPLQSRETLAWQIIPDLSGWQSFRVYLIFSLFDHFFQRGVQDEKREVDGTLTLTQRIYLSVFAPYLSWIWRLTRVWLSEKVHLIKNSEML